MTICSKYFKEIPCRFATSLSCTNLSKPCSARSIINLVPYRLLVDSFTPFDLLRQATRIKWLEFLSNSYNLKVTEELSSVPSRQSPGHPLHLHSPLRVTRRKSP